MVKIRIAENWRKIIVDKVESRIRKNKTFSFDGFLGMAGKKQKDRRNVQTRSILLSILKVLDIAVAFTYDNVENFKY